MAIRYLITQEIRDCMCFSFAEHTSQSSYFIADPVLLFPVIRVTSDYMKK